MVADLFFSDCGLLSLTVPFCILYYLQLYDEKCIGTNNLISVQLSIVKEVFRGLQAGFPIPFPWQNKPFLSSCPTVCSPVVTLQFKLGWPDDGCN